MRGNFISSISILAVIIYFIGVNDMKPHLSIDILSYRVFVINGSYLLWRKDEIIIKAELIAAMTLFHK